MSDALWKEYCDLKIQMSDLIRAHNALAEQTQARIAALEADVAALKAEPAPVMLQPATTDATGL